MKTVDAFFKRPLNYSACNEDGRSELSVAARLAAPGSMLVIAGGGERVLNLLATDQGYPSIDVIDGNETQLFLLELKKAAFLSLPQPGLFGFLGLTATPAKQRAEIYADLIRPQLSDGARGYFDASARGLGSGILYQGEFERFLRIIAGFCRAAFGDALQGFFACRDLDEQRAYFERNIAGVRWRMLMWTLCRKIWFRLLSRDPAFYEYEGLDSYYHYLSSRITHALLDIPAQDNFLLALMLTGRYLPEYDVVPPCYRRASVTRVQENLKHCALKSHHERLDRYLKSSHTQYDLMSLSDVPSYCSASELDGLLALISARLKTPGYVILRQLFSRHAVFQGENLLRSHLRAHSAVEQELDRTDSSFIFRFQLLSRCN